jgi:hypothetical protein
MTTQKETGGAAFPVHAQGDPRYTDEKGLSIRDYFAAKAMLGLIQAYTDSDERAYASCANTSYAMADAMMEARK